VEKHRCVGSILGHQFRFLLMKICQFVVAAHVNTYEQYPPETHLITGIAKRTICEIEDIAQLIIINSQDSIWFWSQAHITIVSLNERIQTEVLKTCGYNGYQILYKLPSLVLFRFHKPTQLLLARVPSYPVAVWVGNEPDTPVQVKTH